MGEFSVAHLFIAVLGALVFIGILFALVKFRFWIERRRRVEKDLKKKPERLR